MCGEPKPALEDEVRLTVVLCHPGCDDISFEEPRDFIEDFRRDVRDIELVDQGAGNLIQGGLSLKGKALGQLDFLSARRFEFCMVFLDAPDELIIVNRDEPTRRFLEARYTMNCVFVPYAGVTSFALVGPPPGRSLRFHQLRLKLNNQVIQQSCLVDPEQVRARLAARGVAQTSA